MEQPKTPPHGTQPLPSTSAVANDNVAEVAHVLTDEEVQSARAARIAALKQQIAEGRYDPDASAIADAMVRAAPEDDAVKALLDDADAPST